MTGLGRRERIAVCLWLAVAVVVWNGLYDLLLARSTQTYLTTAMDVAVRDAAWVSTLWASILLLAGMITIRLMWNRRPPCTP